jgi:hypothetical protein
MFFESPRWFVSFLCLDCGFGLRLALKK